MNVRRHLLACGVAGCAALVVAACGSSGTSSSASGGSTSGSPAASKQTASQLVSQMKTAVAHATSVHLTGDLSSGGRGLGLNLGILRTGGLNGTITQDGVPLRLVSAGGRVYVKTTPAFLRELHISGGICDIMCGKFVEMSGSPANDLSHSLSMNSLTGSLTRKLPTFTKDGSTTINGQSAVVLKGPHNSTLDVAATGTPYPLRVQTQSTAHPSSLTFSQWNKVATPVAPPAKQVINLSQLKAGADNI